MKKSIISLSFVLVLLNCALHAQTGRECSTPFNPAKDLSITSAKKARTAQRSVLYSAPYPLKVFIRVFADNDGSNLAATEADVLRQFANMRNFYAPHNICFILAGYEVTRSTTLNYMDKDNADDMTALEGYVFNSCMNIFIHETLRDDDGTLNGTAYDIPNHYLSIVSTAIESTTNLTVMAHEMGHCVGLLHTFEDYSGAENVTRNSAASCYDCDGDGDLLCDTKADRSVDSDNFNTSCQYTGITIRDDCGIVIPFEPTNVMAYGRRACRDNFTNGQGGRAREYVLDDHESRIMENSIVLTGAYLVSVGNISYAARNFITVSATSFIAAAAAKVNFASRRTVLLPGVLLQPGNGGYVKINASAVYCQ
jgi:Pregnancy-associated plasma protein-A